MRIRFSLGRFFLGLVIVATVIGWWIMDQEAEEGIVIEVPQPVALDDYDVPDTLLEIRSRSQVADHQRRFDNRQEIAIDARLQKVQQSITQFSGQVGSDLVLLEYRPAEMVAVADAHLNDAGSFRQATKAALILELVGHSRGFEYIKKRFLERRARDLKTRQELLYAFDGAWLAADAKVVEAIKKEAEDPNGDLYPHACQFLFKQEIDSWPQVRRQLRLALVDNPYQQSAIIWLNRNRPSVDHAYLAMENGSHAFVLSEYRNRGDEYAAVFKHAESEFRKQLENFEYRTFGRPSSSKFLALWESFCEHCSEDSIEFLTGYFDRESTKRLGIYNRCQLAVLIGKALHRLGEGQAAAKIVAQGIDSMRSYRGYFETRDLLYDCFEELMGKPQCVRLCLEQMRNWRDEVAVVKLAELYADSHNEDLVNQIVGSMNLQEKFSDELPSLSERTVRAIGRIGSKRLPELWQTLPIPDREEVTSSVARQWALQSRTRQEFIEWINANLRPDQPLTIEKVLENPKYPADHWVWHDIVGEDLRAVKLGSEHKFAMVALAHSGLGNLAYDDRFPCEGVVDVMVGELADIASEEFNATCHSYDWVGDEQTNCFVVNNRLYKFTIAGPDSSDDRYSVEAAAEILNAVAIRQRLRGRFFCYATEWGVTLVLYLTPELVSELDEKFGIQPLESFGYYMNY